MTKILLTLIALVTFACTSYSEINTVNVQVEQVEQPDLSYTLHWRVSGWMVGTCSVAVGLNAPIWVMRPPPGTTCQTSWFFDTGPLTNYGYDCVNEFNALWKIYLQESAPGSQWYVSSTFTWNMFVDNCCQRLPPIVCSGEYSISPSACADYCEPNPFPSPTIFPTPTPAPTPTATPRPTGTPRPSPTPRPRG